MPHFTRPARFATRRRRCSTSSPTSRHYPQFLPLCESLVVRARREEGDTEILVADMTVGYKTSARPFTTRVVLDRDGLTIRAEYLDGPFSHLENRLALRAARARRIGRPLHIDYEFRSRTLGLLMGAMFDRAFRKFTEAFEKRADAVYGTV